MLNQELNHQEPFFHNCKLPGVSRSSRCQVPRDFAEVRNHDPTYNMNLQKFCEMIKIDFFKCFTHRYVLIDVNGREASIANYKI